jgi:tripartite-type tricarboxylate transporter receptor subunit TctC
MTKASMTGIVLIIAAVLGGIGTAAAQIYPSRPITMIVPFPAGGPTDTIGRVLADRMAATAAARAA